MGEEATVNIEEIDEFESFDTGKNKETVVEESEEELQDVFTPGEDFPIQYLSLITNIAAQIFGDDFGFNILPYDHEGQQSIILNAGSIKLKDVTIQAAFPVTKESMLEARKAIVSFAYRLYAMEQEAEAEEQGELVVPEKKLWTPGE